MVSREIWKKTYTHECFKNAQITLVLRTRAILHIFDKLTRMFFQNCTRNHTITYTYYHHHHYHHYYYHYYHSYHYYHHYHHHHYYYHHHHYYHYHHYRHLYSD